MTVSRFGGDNAVVSGGASMSLAWPASVTADMAAILVVSWWENNDLQLNTITGFTERAQIVISGSGVTESRFSVQTRDCDATETGNVTVPFNGSAVYGSCALTVLQGEGALTHASISAADTGSGVTATAPSVSGTSGQGLIAAFGLSDPPGATVTSPSGMATTDGQTASNNSCLMWLQSLTATEPTGSKSWEYSTSQAWGGYAVLFNDAGAAAQSNAPRAMHQNRLRRT